MANKDPSQYVQDLKEQDVVLGRGSGPNDRTGNIEFRNLILTRKAEYLAAKTREIKGRIAAEVVNSVRARGGRFLRKLTPSQAKDAGFNKGEEVYELADEPTVMEKAKQTLRQNRANFEKNIQQATETNNNVASQENDINSIPMPDANTIMGAASLMSMNPISNSQASRMLDSDKLPQLRSQDARHLHNILFDSSSISSKDMNSADQMKLSMDLSMLLGSMGSTNHGSNTSGNLSFDSLIKDFSAQDQAALIQQYKSLQDQQQLALTQQYEILKRQHEQMMQNMYPQLNSGNSNDANMNFLQDNMNTFNGQNFQPQCQPNFSPQHTHQMFNQGGAGGMNVMSQNNYPNQKQITANSVTSAMNNFSEDTLSHHRNSTNVFASLVKEYQNEPSEIGEILNMQHLHHNTADSEFSSVTNNLSQDVTLCQRNSSDPFGSFMQQQNTEMTKQASNISNEISQTSKATNNMSTISEFSQLSKDPVINQLGSIARHQDVSDQQKLLQQYQSLQSSDNQPSKPSQDTEEHMNISKPLPTPQDSPHHKRSSRQKKNEVVDSSLTLSFVTGKSLALKLNDDPMNASKSSSTSNKTNDAPKDTSLMSLMSMSVSLSEIDEFGKNLVDNGSTKKEDAQKSQGLDMSLTHMSLTSLDEGWALDESEQRKMRYEGTEI